MSGSTVRTPRPHARMRGIGLLTLAVLALAAPSPTTAHLAATHQHRAWVRYSVNEYIGITTTQVFEQMKYYQNAGDVWSPTVDSLSCWHDLVPGWITSQCVYSLGSGANYVQLGLQGEFHWGTIGYQQHSFQKALYTDAMQRSCYLDWGVIPTGWTSTCEYGRTLV